MRKVHTRIKRHHRINAHQGGARLLRQMKQKFAQRLLKEQQQREQAA